MTARALDSLQNNRLNTPTRGWLALVLLAVFVYIFGLGDQYAPTNGDELVYTHIARLTAASGHWLPLVSELDHMRNTKPPLLFWQAMVAGDWGQHWSLGALRLPSLIYTLLIAGAVGWTVRQITGNLRNACVAACLYLAFFCTFRFGRTYLTSAPETFWLNLPLFVLLWHRLRTPPAVPKTSLNWLTHASFGLALGLGLAYKSFALIAPAAATLWCAQLLSSSVLNWRAVIQTTGKVTLSAVIALGIFALWFVLDPDPASVWQEFVVGENAGKMNNSAGYWQTALRGGGFSMWAQLLAYVQNAGLLAFVALGLLWVGLKTLRQRMGHSGASHKLSPYMVIFLVWLAVWLVVFTLPSQRSARYVIPAMPALAMLMALLWERIARGWFVLSLLLCGIFIGALGRIVWAAHDVGIGTDIELGMSMLAVVASLGVVLAGLFKPGWTRTGTVAATLAVYACFSFTTLPLNGTSGHYEPSTVAQLRGARVAVPNGFNGQFERFQFLLPGNRFEAYDLNDKARSQPGLAAAELTRLLAAYDAVVWWQAEPAEASPPCAPACTVIGSRWEVKGRHQSGEITLANLWYPQTWLFRREWVVRGAR
jgi:4-amino-4-deoxy-L-arabinose transferase-like glycosyltransferase